MNLIDRVDLEDGHANFRALFRSVSKAPIQ